MRRRVSELRLDPRRSSRIEKSRRAALRLLGDRPDAGELTKRAYQQHALLQIYDDFCLEDTTGCGECPFPEQLAQWF